MKLRHVFAIAALLSGCATPGMDTAALDAAHVRDKIRYEAEAGAGRPGAYVCRKYRIGIAEIDWVKGTVIEAKSESIRVKIDDPGNFPHELNGTEMAKGSLVQDKDIGWIPCVKEIAGHSGMD